MSIDIEVINLIANTESVERAAEKIEKLADAGQEAQKAANKLEALIQRLNDKAELMAKGFTRGEATIIAQAKSLGALGDSLEKVIDPLVRIRELSKDPFDSAIGSIRRLEQEFEQLANRAGLAQKGIYLTSQQLREYSRIAAEVKGQLISEGIKPGDSRYQEEFNKRLKETQRIYLDTAVTINQLKREEEALLQQNKLAAEQAARQEEERRRRIQQTAEFEAMVRRAKLEQIENQNRQELDALNAYFRQLERESMIAERNLQRLNKAINREQIISDLQSQGYSASVAGKAATLQLRGASKETVDLYLREATAREKAAKAAREQAAAAEYLRSVEERLKAALDSTNNELNERSVSTLIKYEKALNTMGIQGEAAAAKLAAVRNQLKQVADKEIEGRMRDLSRAISVQMGDVAISLASGMNPFLVLIQQGDQIRGAFEQAALSSEKSKQAMLAATGMIAKSFVDTAKAVGTFFVGAIMTAGNSVLSFVTKVTGLNLTLQALNETLVATGVVGTRFATVITKLATALTAVVGTAVAATAVLGGAFIVGIVSAIKEQNQLAVVLNTTGGLLAMNTQQVIAYAKSISDSNVSTSEAIQVISEMAKAGNLGRESIEMITKSAEQMNRLAGVAIEDTVKAFSKMADEPTKALIELAKRTGEVSPEVISLVQKLEDQGRKGEAAAIAMKALADANAEAARRIEQDLHPVSKFIAYLGKLVKDLWEDIKDISRKALGGSTIVERIQDINDAINTPSMFGWLWNDDLRKQRDALNRTLLNQVEREIEVADQQERNVKAAGMIASIEELRKKNLTEVQKLQEESLRLSNELVKAYQLFGAESEQVKVIQQAILNTEKQIAEVEKRKDRKDISKSAAEVEKLEKYYTKALEKVTDLEIRTKEVAEGQKELSEAQKLALDLFNDEYFYKLTDAEKIVLVTKLEQVHAQEQINLAKKLSLEYSKELVKYNEQSAELTKKIADEYARTQQKIVEETDRLDMRKQLLGANEEQAKAITREYEKQAALSKIDAELSQSKLRIQADFLKLANDNLQDFNYEAYKKAIADAEKQAQEQRKLIIEEYNLKNAEDTVAKFRSVQNTITDIIATAIFEGGEAGSKKLKNILQNAFRGFVIEVIIKPVVGEIIGSLSGLFGQSSFGGGIGAIANSISLARGFTSIISNISRSFSNLGSTIGSLAAAFKYKTLPFSQQSAMLASQEIGMNTASGFLGTIGSYLGGAMTGVSLGRLIGGRYSLGSGSGNSTINLGTAIGSFFGPIGAVTGGIIGGIVNRAFGRGPKQITGSGITGTFSTSGANMVQYTDWYRKGGWFRKSKSGRDYSPISQELDRYLDETIIDFTSAIKAFANTIGLNGNSINGVTKRITISLKDLNDQQKQQAISDALRGFANLLASVAMGTGAFIKQGEDAYNALERLAASFITVNSVLKTLGHTLFSVSIYSADASSKLIDLFGGNDKFISETTAYYEAFYTEQEKMRNLLDQLTESFSSMGLTLPQTKQQYRELVAAQNLNTERGRELFTALIKLAPSFDALKKSIEKLSDSIYEEILRLRGLLLTEGQNPVRSLQHMFDVMTQRARTGDTEALKMLPELSQMLEQSVAVSASTYVELARTRAWLSNSLADTLNTLGMNIPRFDVGTNYVPHDMLAVVHKGEAIVPAKYNPEANPIVSAAISNNNTDEIVQELRSLRSEISMLRYEVRSDILHNAKTAKILDRAVQEGDAILVKVVT